VIWRREERMEKGGLEIQSYEVEIDKRKRGEGEKRG